MNTITERKLKPQTERLYAAIRDEYKKMSSIKKNGKQVFGDDYIIAEIAHKFFKAEKTIEDIVFNRAKVCIFVPAKIAGTNCLLNAKTML